MTEAEFALIPLVGKWAYIKRTMDEIHQLDVSHEHKDNSYKLRRRYNPNHSEAMVKLEEKQLKHEQRAIRIEQNAKWQWVKTLYAVNRDELADTLGDDGYAECHSIMERIFTNEVDDALRKILNDES